MQSLLLRSKATENFKRDAIRFAAGQDVESIVTLGHTPRVKVERTLAQLISAEPELEVQRVVVQGASGCSDFVGEILVDTPTGSRTFSFKWCCRWRAQQEGWSDYFGFPDQIRAAREFGWDCFEEWEEKVAGGVPA